MIENYNFSTEEGQKKLSIKMFHEFDFGLHSVQVFIFQFSFLFLRVVIMLQFLLQSPRLLVILLGLCSQHPYVARFFDPLDFVVDRLCFLDALPRSVLAEFFEVVWTGFNSLQFALPVLLIFNQSHFYLLSHVLLQIPSVPLALLFRICFFFVLAVSIF